VDTFPLPHTNPLYWYVGGEVKDYFGLVDAIRCQQLKSDAPYFGSGTGVNVLHGALSNDGTKTSMRVRSLSCTSQSQDEKKGRIQEGRMRPQRG
jgi:hypothetical protein